MHYDEDSNDSQPPLGENIKISACGLFYQTQRVYSETQRKSIDEDYPTASSSSTEIAQKILSEILKKATKPHRKPKKPRIPMINLNEVINNFKIDEKTAKSITFNENLIICDSSSDYPTPVGALSLHVQQARGGPLKGAPLISDKFLVHLSAQFDYKGYNAGSRITSWVDCNLQTLEEKRREYVKIDNQLDQQCLYMNSQNGFYYLRHNKTNDLLYSNQKAKNLISEGASFVLMRYLARSRFVGTIEVSTLYIDGSLCRNIYGPSSGIVNNKKIDVCKIYRSIIEECGLEHRSVTLMALNGQILKQEWNRCDYLLQINPLVELDFERPIGSEKIAVDVNDDIELLSSFLDTKKVTKNLIQNYMEDHPEIKHLLADYMQTILHLKPDDIFEFTAKYFLSFSPSLLPHSEYFEGPFDTNADDDYEFWKYI